MALLGPVAQPSENALDGWTLHRRTLSGNLMPSANVPLTAVLVSSPLICLPNIYDIDTPTPYISIGTSFHIYIEFPCRELDLLSITAQLPSFAAYSNPCLDTYAITQPLTTYTRT